MIDNKTREDLIKAMNTAVKDAVIVKPIDVSAIPSGSLFIDRSIGIGGYPHGRITEIFGGESAGKSTLSLELCANAQTLGHIPVYIDVEHAMDMEYAKSLGINVNDWVLTQPENAEDAFRLAEAAINNGAKLVVIDSIGAMVASRESEENSDIGDNQIGLMAKLIGKFIRRISGAIKRNDCAVILINQLRAKIGAMPGTSTTDTPGGYILKYGASVRMKITRTGKESGEDPDFITSKIDVQKNKVAPPYRNEIIKIRFGKGIDVWSELIQIGTEEKILKKSGAWYKYDGETIGQGESGASEYLKLHPEIAKTILMTVEKINIDFYMKKLYNENTNEKETE